MSRRNKLQKFAEILAFPNVFEVLGEYSQNPTLSGERGESVEMKGKWNEHFFKNSHPITLELACGKGDYTIGLAQMYPERNFIGVDIKGNRIWRGAKTALEEKLENVAFLRTRIEQIDHFFEEGEVSEIWITFPDPFLNKESRRLTALPFLQRYQKFLKKGGLVHLKTDSAELFEYTVEKSIPNQDIFELLYENSDIYKDELVMKELEIKTFYEKKHLEKGKKITYSRMRLK
jgi:tRNA (guanine-N7-)-methyltransferase